MFAILKTIKRDHIVHHAVLKKCAKLKFEEHKLFGTSVIPCYFLLLLYYCVDSYQLILPVHHCSRNSSIYYCRIWL